MSARPARLMAPTLECSTLPCCRSHEGVFTGVTRHASLLASPSQAARRFLTLPHTPPSLDRSGPVLDTSQVLWRVFVCVCCQAESSAAASVPPCCERPTMLCEPCRRIAVTQPHQEATEPHQRRPWHHALCSYSGCLFSRPCGIWCGERSMFVYGCVLGLPFVLAPAHLCASRCRRAITQHMPPDFGPTAPHRTVLLLLFAFCAPDGRSPGARRR